MQQINRNFGSSNWANRGQNSQRGRGYRSRGFRGVYYQIPDADYIPITEIKPIGFPKIDESKIPPDPKKLPSENPNETVKKWVENIPNKQSPVPVDESEPSEELRIELNKYERTYVQGEDTGESSFTIASDNRSPLELKLKEVFDEIGEKQKNPITVDTSDWPELDIPYDYDDNPEVAQLFANIHSKFHKPDDADIEVPFERLEISNPIDDREDHDSILSGEVVQMGSDDNKFEASELVEYQDLSWCIAVPIDRERTEDKNVYRHLVYSYQKGIDRIFVTQEKTAELKNTLIIKYRQRNGETEVVPVYSALPSTGLVSLKYRHNKGIEMRLYGVVNFVDFVKDKDCMSHKTIVWTDALGPLYLTAADRSNIRRKLMITEEKTFAPLRMCQMTVKGEFNTTVSKRYTPKWTVASFQPLIEEANKDPNIGRNLWPARVLRFDDLILDRPCEGSIHWFRSLSKQEVIVYAGANLTGIINSAGSEYAMNGVMMGFVVPYFEQETFAYYDALIIGPPRVVMVLTEGRFLNYYPKTWAPSIEKMDEKYRQEHDNKTMVRQLPLSDEKDLLTVRQPYKVDKKGPLKSLGGFNEFHFNFKHSPF